jgi:hypothetical protein
VLAWARNATGVPVWTRGCYKSPGCSSIPLTPHVYETRGPVEALSFRFHGVTDRYPMAQSTSARSKVIELPPLDAGLRRSVIVITAVWAPAGNSGDRYNCSLPPLAVAA